MTLVYKDSECSPIFIQKLHTWRENDFNNNFIICCSAAWLIFWAMCRFCCFSRSRSFPIRGRFNHSEGSGDEGSCSCRSPWKSSPREFNSIVLGVFCPLMWLLNLITFMRRLEMDGTVMALKNNITGVSTCWLVYFHWSDSFKSWFLSSKSSTSHVLTPLVWIKMDNMSSRSSRRPQMKSNRTNAWLKMTETISGEKNYLAMHRVFSLAHLPSANMVPP